MPVTKTCSVCMNQFQVPPSRDATALTCSRACKAMLKSQLARAAWVDKECPECGKTYQCPERDSDRRKFCSEACKAGAESRKFADAPRSSGGESVRNDGYIAEYTPRHPHASSNYVLQHRLVMERWLRETGEAPHFMVEVDGVHYLRRDIEVHHKNERRDSNARANLVACTTPAHKAIHRGEPVGINEAWPLDGLLVAEVERKIARVCKCCDKAFTLDPGQLKRSAGEFCSRACYDKDIRAIDTEGKVPMTCLSCGSSFVAQRNRVAKGTAKFCSNPCRLKGLADARRKSTQPS